MAAAMGALLAGAPPVRAQVLQLGEHGAMTVFDAPAVFDARGATPIEPPHRPEQRRTRAVGATDAAHISKAADAAALSPALVRAVAEQESGLRARVVSRAGAIGEMQLMPETARVLRVDARNSEQNYRGGAAYLRILLRRYDGDVVRALSAYNAGPGAVDRHHGAPPFRETQAYVAAVLERLSRAAGRGGGGCCLRRFRGPVPLTDHRRQQQPHAEVEFVARAEVAADLGQRWE